jgi:hypothetical protein
MWPRVRYVYVSRKYGLRFSRTYRTACAAAACTASTSLPSTVRAGMPYFGAQSLT